MNFSTFQDSAIIIPRPDNQLCEKVVIIVIDILINMNRFRDLLVAALILHTCHSFNIDTKNLVIQQGPRDTCDDCMFGFSVAQHREAGVPW